MGLWGASRALALPGKGAEAERGRLHDPDFVSGYPSHFPSTSLAIPAPSLTGPSSSDL